MKTETRKVIEGKFESSRLKMRQPHKEIVIKLPKLKKPRKIDWKKLIKSFCF